MVRWQKSTDTLRDTATIQQPSLDLALTSLRFDAGFASQHFHRAVSRADHVDKRTSTAVGAQERQSRRGLKRIDFSFRRYEPVSTVTTVSKLVDLLATTFSGDLMDSLTDFERRVASWEHDAKETLSDLIQNRSRHQKVWRKVVDFGIICSSTLLARQNGRNL